MKIRTYKQLLNGVYKVSIHTSDWSEGDKTLISRYGEPTIDLGGIYDAYTGTTSASSFVPVMTGSPFSKKFDMRDYTDSDDAHTDAAAWASHVRANIHQAVSTLRSNTDNFTDEEVETV